MARPPQAPRADPPDLPEVPPAQEVTASDRPPDQAPALPPGEPKDGSIRDAWRPEDPASWKPRDEPKPSWSPEDPEAWQKAAELRQAREAEQGKAVGAAPWVVARTRRDARRRRSRRHKRKLRWVLLGVGLVGAAAGAIVLDAYYQSYKVATSLEAITGDLNQARSSLDRGKLPAGDPLTEAVNIADAAQDQVANARWTFDLVGKIPLLDRPVLIVRQQVIAAGEWATSAAIVRNMLISVLGDKALQVGDLQTITDKAEPPPILSDGKVNVEVVRNLTPMLEDLLTHLEKADAAIKAMPTLPYPHRLADFKERALTESAASIEAAKNALVGIRLLPAFLGDGGPKTYYLALQNYSDQRGTGGAVLAYGMLKVEDGQFTLVDAGGIEAIDNEDVGIRGVTLPPAVQWYITNAHVNPRLANGANYSGDFPVVATAWAAMVEKATGTPIDGVIALDPTAIAYALGGNTEFSIPSYPDPITGQNAAFVIANDQYRLDKSLQQLIPGELIAAAWPKLRQPSPFVRKLQQMGVGLHEKHIQIWSKDPELETLITNLGWDGALQANPGDYLFLAHDKRNGNKVDYYLHQNITYDVTIQPTGDIQSTYSVALSSDVPPDQPPPIAGREGYGLNVAMENLYVPKAAVFQDVEPKGLVSYDTSPKGFVKHVESDFLVLTKPVELFPDAPKTIVFTYSVPGVIQTSDTGNLYQLTIQHQVLVNPATITVNVTLPEGTQAIPTEGWTINGNVATYTTTLTQDIVISLAF